MLLTVLTVAGGGAVGDGRSEREPARMQAPGSQLDTETWGGGLWTEALSSPEPTRHPVPLGRCSLPRQTLSTPCPLPRQTLSTTLSVQEDAPPSEDTVYTLSLREGSLPWQTLSTPCDCAVLEDRGRVPSTAAQGELNSSFQDESGPQTGEEHGGFDTEKMTGLEWGLRSERRENEDTQVPWEGVSSAEVMYRGHKLPL